MRIREWHALDLTHVNHICGTRHTTEGTIFPHSIIYNGGKVTRSTGLSISRPNNDSGMTAMPLIYSQYYIIGAPIPHVSKLYSVYMYTTHHIMCNITHIAFTLPLYLPAKKKPNWLIHRAVQRNEPKKKIKTTHRANDMQIDALHLHGPSNIMESDAASTHSHMRNL